MYVATPQTLNSFTKMDNLLIIKILQRNTEIDHIEVFCETVILKIYSKP